MSPFSLRAPRALVLGLLLVGSPLRPALAADDFQRYLGAAVQLYENLEYERALAQVQRARTVARGVEQDVSLGLHEGIFLAELGRWNEARVSFETALLLDPAAKLPLSVSPKVEAQFERISQSVNAAIARRKQGASLGTPAPATASTDAKPVSASPVALTKSPGQKPVADVKPLERTQGSVSEESSEQTQVAASDRPEQTRPNRLMPPEPSPALTPKAEVAPRISPVVPLVLLGTAAVTGAVGGFFSGNLGSSTTAVTKNEVLATSLLGTAAAAFAGAVVTSVIMTRSDTSDEPVAADTAH